MSPTCIIKPKQSIYQQKSKPKYLKNKQKQNTEGSIATTETKQEIDQYIYIELDTKCSCPPSTLKNQASIQFSRRYLQCQSSMPIAILRSYIQQLLPHSSFTQVSFFDSNDRLLNDSDRLHSLKNTTLSTHIPIRFTLFNTITSLGHCLCSSSSSSSSIVHKTSSSCPSVIKRETIDQTLSTCSLFPPPPPTSTSTSSLTSLYSPCLSSSPSPSSNTSSNSISIVNLLTPPLSHSSFSIENIVDSNQSIIDEITSQFGEICPPLQSTKKPRHRLSKKVVSSNVPLDLSLKKRPSPFDIFSSQTKWIKT